MKASKNTIDPLSGIIAVVIVFSILGILKEALIIVGCAIGGLLAIAIIWGISSAVWQWLTYCLSTVLPKGSKLQTWFNERHLDSKYSLRALRRKVLKAKAEGRPVSDIRGFASMSCKDRREFEAEYERQQAEYEREQVERKHEKALKRQRREEIKRRTRYKYFGPFKVYD